MTETFKIGVAAYIISIPETCFYAFRPEVIFVCWKHITFCATFSPFLMMKSANLFKKRDGCCTFPISERMFVSFVAEEIFYRRMLSRSFSWIKFSILLLSCSSPYTLYERANWRHWSYYRSILMLEIDSDLLFNFETCRIPIKHDSTRCITLGKTWNVAYSSHARKQFSSSKDTWES